MTTPTEFYTCPEIARLLRCRESKVSTWIKSGRLPAINVSESTRPRYRVRRADLDQFLAGAAVVPVVRTERRQKRTIPSYV